MDLVIDSKGRGRAIYGETFDLHALGRLAIRRGSHVEPTRDGRWTADLSPVDGPVLGPFAKRSEALAAEVTWLHTYWLDAAQPSGFRPDF